MVIDNKKTNPIINWIEYVPCLVINKSGFRLGITATNPNEADNDSKKSTLKLVTVGLNPYLEPE